MSTCEQKQKTLKRIRKFELLNRLACYACVIPFFYTASCLGQKQPVPLLSKVGTAGFVASVFAAAKIKKEEEKIKEEIRKKLREKQSSRC